jgi:hypothetical protein
MCGGRIPRSKPGTSTGTRGTKAYFSPEARAWECIECRSEGVRAEIAQQEIEDAIRRRARPMMVEGEACDVIVTTSLRIVSGYRALADAMQAGTVDSLEVRAVPESIAREMEAKDWERMRHTIVQRDRQS